MKQNEVFDFIQGKIEDKQNGKNLTNISMAKKMGVSEDTYSRYKNGRSRPQGVQNFLKLLSELKKDDIYKVVKSFK